MLTSRSIFILFFVSLAISLTALPSMAKSDNNSKLLPYTIKSASEFDYPPFSIVRDDGAADLKDKEVLVMRMVCALIV